MQVGDYIRFKDKNGCTYIRKIIDLPKDKRYGAIQIDKPANYSDMVSPKNIIGEPKENIIDLIEIDDYVDKLRVINKDKNHIVMEIFDERIYIFRGEPIKSVLTKEQFESMEYEANYE